MSDDYSNAGMAHHMDAFLAEMRNVLHRLSDETAVPRAGRGLGAHGRVSATVGHRGHLTELAIDDPWARSVDNETLVKAVKEAVCKAVDDVHRQIDSLPPVVVQLDEMVEALGQTLDEISNGLARVVGQSASS